MTVKPGKIGAMKGAKLTGKDAVDNRTCLLLVSGGDDDDEALRRFNELLKVTSLSEMIYILDGELEGASEIVRNDYDDD